MRTRVQQVVNSDADASSRLPLTHASVIVTTSGRRSSRRLRLRRRPTAVLALVTAAAAVATIHTQTHALVHAEVTAQTPVDAQRLFFTDLPIASRFARIIESGVEAPPLALHVDAEVPHGVNTLLAAYSLRWDELDGNVQRLLLWDAGYVLGSDAMLARVYTKCGLAMDDAVLAKAGFDATGCLSTPCRMDSSVFRADVRAMACPDSMVAQVAKCAVLDRVPSVSAAAIWSQEANNTDVPQPLIVRSSARTYAIHLLGTSAASLGAAEQCPPHLRLSIPCTTYEAASGWCVPRPSGQIAPLLRVLQARRHEASSLDSVSSSSVGTEARSDDLTSIPLGVWIAVAVLSAVVMSLYAALHAHAWHIKQSVAVALSVSIHDSDVVAAPLSMPTLVLNVDMQPELGQPTRNGLAKSASYSDIICSSEVMMAFQCDAVVLAHRVPMVDITFEQLVGQGAAGEIHVGALRGHRDRVALKQVLRVRMHDPNEIEKFAREIQLHVTLRHAHIARVIGVAWTSFQHLVLVLERTPGGDLLRALRLGGKRWTWAIEKLRIARGVAEALAYLHGRAQPVVHRDIKSRNILVHECTLALALCDFGAACSVDTLRADFTTTDPVGTILWSAPEVITAQTYSEKADVYSFGVVLTELDTRKLPYRDEKDSTGRRLQAVRIARMVVDGEIAPTLSAECPEFIQTLAHACLRHDPASRPSARELALYLGDPAHYSFAWTDSDDLGLSAKWEMKRGSLFCF